MKSTNHKAKSKHTGKKRPTYLRNTSHQDNSPCRVFGKCGGCSLLDIPHKDQLAAKQKYIQELFAKTADKDYIHNILGMDKPFAYRDKIISPFVRDKRSKSGKVKVISGMYIDGTHKVIPTETCPIENPYGQKIVRAIRQIMERHDIQPYDEDSGTGFLRHAVIRVGHESSEILVTLVTNSKEFPHSKSFCKELRAAVPEITSIVQNINTRQTNVILGEVERTLYGPGFILDTLCGLSFRISSRSFYQVNAKMTSVLYESAIKLAEVSGCVMIDAYCGTGTLGLVAAKAGASKVIGVDSIREAIQDARLNAKHNGLDNVEFISNDATQFMEEVASKQAFDKDKLVLMMDPPRAGSTEKFIQAACSLAPKRIVYISCNPKTQQRDVEQFIAHGYKIDSIIPVDMFPHTEHVENIVRLQRD